MSLRNDWATASNNQNTNKPKKQQKKKICITFQEINIRTVSYHYAPTRVATPNANKDVGQEELPFTAGGNAK
jgi:hypothetical protein